MLGIKEEIELKRKRNIIPFKCPITGKTIKPFTAIYSAMSWRRDTRQGKLMIIHVKMSEEEFMLRRLKDNLDLDDEIERSTSA